MSKHVHLCASMYIYVHLCAFIAYFPGEKNVTEMYSIKKLTKIENVQ